MRINLVDIKTGRMVIHPALVFQVICCRSEGRTRPTVCAPVPSFFRLVSWALVWSREQFVGNAANATCSERCVVLPPSRFLLMHPAG